MRKLLTLASAARASKVVLIAQVLAAMASARAVDVPDRYSAYVDQGNGGSGQVDPNAAVATLGPLDAGGGIIEGTARAGSSSLGVYATANAGDPSQINLIRSGAGMRITDGFISGSGDTVQASLNVFVEGALGIRFQTPVQGWFNSYSTVYLGVTVIGADGTRIYNNNSFHQVSVGQYGDVPLNEGRTNSGALGAAPWVSSSFGWDSIAATVSTEELVLPVNQQFEIDIGITAVAQNVNTTLSTPVTAVVDFSHTLGFAFNSPIMSLPDGFSFDAQSVGIVDNRCTTGCLVALVPEPTTVWLLSVGLAMVGLRFGEYRLRISPRRRVQAFNE